MPMVSMNGQEFVYVQNNGTLPVAISVYPRANLVATQEKSFVLFTEELLRTQQALSLYIEFERILNVNADEIYVQPVVCVLNGSSTSIVSTPPLEVDNTNVAAAAYRAAWVSSTSSQNSVAVVCMVDHLPSEGVFSLDVVLLATGQRLLNDPPTLISAPRPVIVQATQTITANSDEGSKVSSVVITSDGHPGFVGYARYRCVFSMTSSAAATSAVTNMTSTSNMLSINSSQPIMPLFINETTLICPFTTSLLPR